MSEFISSPRLHWSPLRMTYNNIPVTIESKNVLFGLLCFLEFGSFQFCQEIDCILENGNIMVNNFKNFNDFKCVQQECIETNILSVKFGKCFGSNENEWDENFLLVCILDFEQGWGAYDINILNNPKINNLIQNKLKHLYREFNNELYEDIYEIPQYYCFYDAILKAKTKQLFKIPNIEIQYNMKKPKKKKIKLKDLEIKTKFTFLQGNNEIIYEI